VYLRGEALIAQSFDPDEGVLDGEPTMVASPVESALRGTGAFSVSRNGVLVYQPVGAAEGSTLTWFDRSGQRIGTLGDPATYEFLELSPDGQFASVSVLDEAQKGHDIWVFDVARGVRARFTSDAGDELTSAWSPNSREIVFNSTRSGMSDLFIGTWPKSNDRRLTIDEPFTKFSYSWSHDGRFLLFASAITGSANQPAQYGGEVWVKPMRDEGMHYRLLETPFDEAQARFAPGDRWVAYQSNESGRTEVYVVGFAPPRLTTLVSTAGGSSAKWRADGREMFYLAPDGMLMSAAVSAGDDFRVDAVRPLFQTTTAGARVPYAVTRDGQRFLMITGAQRAVLPITLVTGWLPTIR
jgi:dipeptidyl aminopeptidase/acylaminoacyl peptidase